MPDKKWFVLRCPVDDLLARFLNNLEEAKFTTVSVMFRNPNPDIGPYYEVVCWAPYPLVEGLGVSFIPSFDPSTHGADLVPAE